MAIAIVGTYVDFRPLIRCRIAAFPHEARNGPDVTALVDSGATDCTISLKLQAQIGAAVHGEVHTTAVGTSGFKPITTINLAFVGLNSETGQMERWDVSKARCFVDDFDPNADMILGMNVMRLQTLVIAHGIPTILVK